MPPVWISCNAESKSAPRLRLRWKHSSAAPPGLDHFSRRSQRLSAGLNKLRPVQKTDGSASLAVSEHSDNRRIQSSLRITQFSPAFPTSRFPDLRRSPPSHASRETD